VSGFLETQCSNESNTGPILPCFRDTSTFSDPTTITAKILGCSPWSRSGTIQPGVACVCRVIDCLTILSVFAGFDCLFYSSVAPTLQDYATDVLKCLL